uniref:Mobile element protein n=1 Tax=Heterorhabditis bacteriophora TaxID=37862 RepID=A0A1I7XCP7_HETBA
MTISGRIKQKVGYGSVPPVKRGPKPAYKPPPDYAEQQAALVKVSQLSISLKYNAFSLPIV